MQILDNNSKPVSEAVAIRAYFGLRPNDKLPDFMNELKALDAASKTELAVGAAKELGWTVTP